MTNKLFFFSIFLLIQSAFSEEKSLLAQPLKCGEYKVSGVARFDKGLKIIVHEKTLSQITISFKGLESIPLATYVDQPIWANIILDEKFDGTLVTANSIQGKIALRAPDPLNPSDTGFEFQKELPCKK